MNETILSACLISWIIRATALLGLVWIANRCLQSATRRHLLWTCGLVATITIPLVTLALPALEIPLRSAELNPPNPPATRALPPVSGVASSVVSEANNPTTPIAASVSLNGTNKSNATDIELGLNDHRVATTQPGLDTDSIALETESAPPVSWRKMLLVVWLVGTIVIATLTLVGRFRLTRFREHGTPVPKSHLKHVTDSFGFQRTIHMVASDNCRVPLTFGVLQPVVVLPADYPNWDNEKLSTVLQHELSHIARLDSVWLGIALLAQAVLWFNPMVWLATRQLRREAEQAVDDALLRDGRVVPSTYAKLLTEFVAMNPPRRAITMARPSGFSSRLNRILSTKTRRSGLSGRTAIPTILVFAVITVSVATAQVVERISKESAEPPIQQDEPEPRESAPLSPVKQAFRIPSDAELKAMTLVNPTPSAARRAVDEDPKASRRISVQIRSFDSLRTNLERALRLAGPTDHKQWRNVGEFLEEFSQGMARKRWLGCDFAPAASVTQTHIPVANVKAFLNGIGNLGVTTKPARRRPGMELYRATESYEGWIRVFANRYATFSTRTPQTEPNAASLDCDARIRIFGGLATELPATRSTHFWREAAHWVPTEKTSNPLQRELTFLTLKCIERSYTESRKTDIRFNTIESGESQWISQLQVKPDSSLTAVAKNAPKHTLFSGIPQSKQSRFHAHINVAMDNHRRRLAATVLDISQREITRRYKRLSKSQKDAIKTLITKLGDVATESRTLNLYSEVTGPRGSLTYIAGVAGDAKPVEDFLDDAKLTNLMLVSKSKSKSARSFYRLVPARDTGMKPMVIATTDNAVWFAVGDQCRDLIEEKLQAARPGTTTETIDIRLRAVPIFEALSLTKRQRSWENYPADSVRIQTTSNEARSEVTTKVSLEKDLTRLFGEWLAEFSRDTLELD